MTYFLFIAIMLAINIAIIKVSYDGGYAKGKCEGVYGTGAIYEDGRYFLPSKK